MNLTVNRGVTAMELIEVITSKENLNRAYKKVVENKGAGGIDEMTVKELGDYIREKYNNGISQEDIYKVANLRLGWYRRSGMNVVNFIISRELLETKIKDSAGLLNPLSYYLSNAGI